MKGVLPYISKDPMIDRDIGKRFGFWPEGSSNDLRSRPFYVFFQKDQDELILANLMNYFQAVSEKWAGAWSSTGRGAVLNKTNGFNALMRFFRDSYLYATTDASVVEKAVFRQILDRTSLTDSDFTTERYPPGSSGASLLYRELLSMTRIRDS